MKIAIIAGEVSGDQLGGWLMAALKRQAAEKNIPLTIIGVGGESMQAQGLQSIFPMHDIALMGVFEILPHLRTIKRRMRETIDTIVREQPDVVVTIDSPGFSTRVVKAVRAHAEKKPHFIHYVAPSVWSHRPERAKKFATLFDELLVLFPFEPPYFTREGLTTHDIGHEVAWQWREKGDGNAFRARHHIYVDAPLLAIFPGSRHGELKRMLPPFHGAVCRLHKHLPTLRVVIQVPAHHLTHVRQQVASWPGSPIVLPSTEEKKDLFAAATAALSKSGTVAMECAFAGLPLVVTYRANPISIALVRRLLTIRFAHIANIMADREIIPELIQETCTATHLANAVLPLLTSDQARQAQRESLQDFAMHLKAKDAQSPSDKAAAIILNRF